MNGYTKNTRLSDMSEFMIYPVYYREGYGWQQDNPEGTDGVVLY